MQMQTCVCVCVKICRLHVRQGSEHFDETERGDSERESLRERRHEGEKETQERV